MQRNYCRVLALLALAASSGGAQAPCLLSGNVALPQGVPQDAASFALGSGYLFSARDSNLAAVALDDGAPSYELKLLDPGVSSVPYSGVDVDADLVAAAGALDGVIRVWRMGPEGGFAFDHYPAVSSTQAFAIDDGVLVASQPLTQLVQVLLPDGLTGQWTSPPVQLISRPGGALETAGFGAQLDLDGDFLVVGAPGENRAYVYELNVDSVPPAQLLATLDGPAGSQQFGFSVCVGSGLVAVGDPRDDYSQVVQPGRVFYSSSSSAWTLHELVNPFAVERDRFGYSLAALGGALVVGGPGGSINSQGSQLPPVGRTSLYRFLISGGQLVPVLQGTVESEDQNPGKPVVKNSGARVALSEGFLATGTGGANSWVSLYDLEFDAGEQVFLIPESVLTELPANGDVPVADGGAQYQLVTCPPRPFASVLILGSLSGVGSGFSLGSVFVPLQIDAYTLFTLDPVNQSMAMPGLAQLDAQGRAQVKIKVPAGVVLPVGLSSAHAALLFAFAGPAIISDASNPAVLSLE